MADGLLLSARPGIKTSVHFEPDGSFVINTVQDVEPVLDHNKRLQNHDDRGWSKSKDFRRAASIPAVIQVKWLNEYGINVWDAEHWPRLRRLLNDPDWRWLRTAHWRV